jgi:predicted dehydrogenase
VKRGLSEVYRAAVVGLGNIGFKLNLDPLRKDVWSHVAAYEACSRTELVAGVEIDSENRSLFREHKPKVPVFERVQEMMESCHPEIVSICTPGPAHRSVLEEIVRYPVRAIFCEKPIAPHVPDGEEMVRICREKGIVLAVNHTRRWDPNYLQMSKAISDGRIGKPKLCHSFYSGQVYNIGTHLFDAIRMFLDGNARMVSALSPNIGEEDPHVSGWISFDTGAVCTVLPVGKREDVLFEIDVVGENGRIRIVQNGESVESFAFADSLHYSGYRELRTITLDPPEPGDRFVNAIYDIVQVIEGTKADPNCSGKDGLAAIALAHAMVASARAHGRPVAVRDRSEGKTSKGG